LAKGACGLPVQDSVYLIGIIIAGVTRTRTGEESSRAKNNAISNRTTGRSFDASVVDITREGLLLIGGLSSTETKPTKAQLPPFKALGNNAQTEELRIMRSYQLNMKKLQNSNPIILYTGCFPYEAVVRGTASHKR